MVRNECLECHKLTAYIQQEKSKKTSIERYGVDNILKNREYIKSKTIEKLGVDNIFKDTNFIKSKYIEKLGVEHPSKMFGFGDKVKKTKLLRYGNSTYNNSELTKVNTKITLNKKYGVDNVMQLKNVKNKRINTLKKIYNVEKIHQIPSVLEKMKLSARIRVAKQLEKSITNGGQITPFYNPKGCQYFNQMMLETNTFIQHAENGGEYHIKELGYWVDGYDKENNIVYEYDEKHHFDKDGKLNKKDVQRQKEIEEFLKCKFVRFKC